jgi:hypothetical protein
MDLPSTALTAKWEEVKHMAVLHLAVRAHGFNIAALHDGEALVWCRCHGCGVGVEDI